MNCLEQGRKNPSVTRSASLKHYLMPILVIVSCKSVTVAFMVDPELYFQKSNYFMMSDFVSASLTKTFHQVASCLAK